MKIMIGTTTLRKKHFIHGAIKVTAFHTHSVFNNALYPKTSSLFTMVVNMIFCKKKM